ASLRRQNDQNVENMESMHLKYEESGRAVVFALAASSALGHLSCAALADYANNSDLPESSQLVADAFAATRLDDRAYPAQGRIKEWLSSHPLGQLASNVGAQSVTDIGN